LRKNAACTVIRGKLHQTKRVSVWKLVVGDVVLLQAGMRVPADCLIINSSDLRIDETPEDEETEVT